jgi:hypothetical protein
MDILYMALEDRLTAGIVGNNLRPLYYPEFKAGKLLIMV